MAREQRTGGRGRRDCTIVLVGDRICSAEEDHAATRGVIVSEEDEVVAVDDFAFVRRAEVAGQVSGGPAEQVREFGGVVVDQAAGDDDAVRRRRGRPGRRRRRCPRLR